jgi:thiol-disulfide isomerase/thioredoxin
MAKMGSAMVELGTKAHPFSLLDVISGSTISPLTDRPNKSGRQPKAHVIMFICNHCPFVKHISKGLSALANDYQNKDIQFLAISSNDVSSYPDDSPEKMRETALLNAYPFPYLFDENQAVAKAYHAVCTPDFFIYDEGLSLVYRGQFDDARPSNDLPVDGHSIRAALDALLLNKPVPEPQLPSIGCSIKWK